MALTTFLLQSAKFETTDITSVISATIDETATAANLTSDGSGFVNLIVVDEKTVDISIETHDSSVFRTFRVGECGELVLKEKKRTCGDGLSSVLTITIADATFISATSSKVTVGSGTTTLNFRAYNAATDGTGEVIAYSLV